MVAATGPSLTADVAAACRGVPVIAVNDAWRVIRAEILYACDANWWDHHNGCPEFTGERWSCHGNECENDKGPASLRYGLNLVRGAQAEGFSTDPSRIHYGGNSGFQAVNFALLKLGFVGRVVLVGFDMRAPNGRRHFFGNHPGDLHREKTEAEMQRYFGGFIAAFAAAAPLLPSSAEIVNATPGSALNCFKQMDLRDALSFAT